MAGSDFKQISDAAKYFNDHGLTADEIIEEFIREKIMPLVKGKKAKSKKGFSENIRREMHEGKKQSQAVAIAYSEARKKKKRKK